MQSVETSESQRVGAGVLSLYFSLRCPKFSHLNECVFCFWVVLHLPFIHSQVSSVCSYRHCSIKKQTRKTFSFLRQTHRGLANLSRHLGNGLSLFRTLTSITSLRCLRKPHLLVAERPLPPHLWPRLHSLSRSVFPLTPPLPALPLAQAIVPAPSVFG